MKKALLLSLFVAAIGSTGFAQSQQVAATQQTSIDATAKLQTQQMATNLGLSKEQTSKIFEVNKNVAAKSNSVTAMADVKKAHEAQEQVNNYRNEQYQKILTKEQYQKWVSQNQGARTSK